MSEENKSAVGAETPTPVTTPAPDTAAGKFTTKFIQTNLHV